MRHKPLIVVEIVASIVLYLSSYYLLGSVCPEEEILRLLAAMLFISIASLGLGHAVFMSLRRTDGEDTPVKIKVLPVAIYCVLGLIVFYFSSCGHSQIAEAFMATTTTISVVGIYYAVMSNFG